MRANHSFKKSHESESLSLLCNSLFFNKRATRAIHSHHPLQKEQKERFALFKREICSCLTKNERFTRKNQRGKSQLCLLGTWEAYSKLPERFFSLLVFFRGQWPYAEYSTFQASNTDLRLHRRQTYWIPFRIWETSVCGATRRTPTTAHPPQVWPPGCCS